MRKLSRLQIIAIGFAAIVVIGTLLLMLPAASADGKPTPFLTSLFTATSASCVTGLVMVDTAMHWSLFGQIIILLLIQVGGLGFVTVATLFFSLASKNMGLRKRALMADSINATHIGGLKGLTKEIILGTAVIEGIGAILLSLRFVKQFGAARGIYFGIFHSISAFCNAGFDLLGVTGEYNSFVNYSDDLLVNITLIALITIGGIGFLVWDDIRRNKLHFKRYQLHTKLVLLSSAVLTLGGAVVFAVFERNGILQGMGMKEKILASLFSSVTCRTAGMNTVDLAMLSKSSILIMSFLMYIGGSPGSTAGGVKTTTVAVAVIYMFASLRGEKRPVLFGRSFEDDVIKKASTVMIVNFFLSFIAAMVISTVQDLPLADVIFETSSAMGTVGMTTGITRDLVPVSQIIIIFLMFCGRVGSTSFALALLEKRTSSKIAYPVENITVG